MVTIRLNCGLHEGKWETEPSDRRRSEMQSPYTSKRTSTDRNVKVESNSASRDSFLEAVWSALDTYEWKPLGALKKVSGADEGLLIRLVDFLKRWDFIETRRTPELRIRRRANAIPPLAGLEILRTAATDKAQRALSNQRRLAERVMCRRCGSKSFLHVAKNEVECAECHERQWFAIDH